MVKSYWAEGRPQGPVTEEEGQPSDIINNKHPCAYLVFTLHVSLTCSGISHFKTDFEIYCVCVCVCVSMVNLHVYMSRYLHSCHSVYTTDISKCCACSVSGISS